jgi:hypothetical protein
MAGGVQNTSVVVTSHANKFAYDCTISVFFSKTAAAVCHFSQEFNYAEQQNTATRPYRMLKLS